MNIITLKSSYLVSNAWLLVINLFLPNLSGLRKRIGILKVSLEPIHKSFFINNWIYFWEGYELGLISTEKILTLVRADPNFRRILFFFLRPLWSRFRSQCLVTCSFWMWVTESSGCVWMLAFKHGIGNWNLWSWMLQFGRQANWKRKRRQIPTWHYSY